MAPNGLASHASLLTPSGLPSDVRNNPRFPRPGTGLDLSARNSELCTMEKKTPVTGKRRGGSRKACNECKQQKTPAAACSRCRRLQIECKVEPTFKRISKRRRNAEMEQEIADLRRRLATNSENPHAMEANVSDGLSQCSEDVFCGPDSVVSGRQRPLSDPLEPQPLPTPLTIHREASILSQEDKLWTLEDISLPRSRVARLFEQYFKYYHPFLPLLSPQKAPEEYLRRCPLLAWTIICVASRRAPSEPGLLSAISVPFSRLLWSTITGIAMQLGLHRPVQAEEFTTFRMEVQGEAKKDRLQTWVLCNVVAQNVATGYGQPPSTIYDWALEPPSLRDADYNPPDDLRIRLRIEKFCDRVTKSLYSSKPEPSEFISSEKLLIVQLLENELRDMEVEFGRDISNINMIHLRAAELHLRYFVFLGSNARSDDLTKLFIATTSFLGRVLDLETSPGELIGHATNYILQMIVSAAFALMKLLKSDFSRHIDFDHGKLLFNGAISAIRRISVMDHDRPVRLADILAQMWNAGTPDDSMGEDVLQLKVRCRMSMSHVYDTVWRWRQRFRPMKSIEDAQNTMANPNLSTTDGSLARQQAHSLEDQSLILPANFDQGAFISEAGFSEVFDSLNWVFDGIPDSFVAPPVM
ncbi:transcription factor domain-containing protein [Aspergillus tanneri]|uniref:Zn(2)-C6 fungal-type domain-containing protein n=1 Tax=Aspergillus tanneri TaxID=1220188 RepID=A0A5M9MFD2_9EURO|nr:uncharacterized protein ATNIH1004_007070 [Aspergillus tanneri]KAA8645651.1 hypothetical protein ATNIH1004_007070 [Aspergillus tanneri]